MWVVYIYTCTTGSGMYKSYGEGDNKCMYYWVRLVSVMWVVYINTCTTGLDWYKSRGGDYICTTGLGWYKSCGGRLCMNTCISELGWYKSRGGDYKHMYYWVRLVSPVEYNNCTCTNRINDVRFSFPFVYRGYYYQ